MLNGSTFRCCSSSTLFKKENRNELNNRCHLQDKPDIILFQVINNGSNNYCANLLYINSKSATNVF